MKILTLKRLYNTEFKSLYWKFVSKPKSMSSKELEVLLSLGAYFVCLEDESIQKLGYRIFLLYSKNTGDYKPLYELSLNKGFIPIAQFIDDNLKYGERFGNLQTVMNEATNKDFRQGSQYKTIGQTLLYNNVIATENKSYIVVAPTSYGKTELILSFLDTNLDKNVCVITPTKSLLAQTKKRILNHIGNQKIITRPEMYSEDSERIIAVLTQERLLRLLQENPELSFDILIVDEAHNLLDRFSKDNNRSVLLASVILICYRRNENLSCRYLTPFLQSKESIVLKHVSESLEWFTVSEFMKSEVFYFHDIIKGTKEMLDQYSGAKQKLISLGSLDASSDAGIVIFHADRKNIIYINSPKKIEQFAKELANLLEVTSSERIKKAVLDLRNFIHEDYSLASSLERGVIYHHGSVPESVRYYIETLYSEYSELKMLIANSTLLEGVNIPATKMFILDPNRGSSYLSSSDFKNLIGRICRFGEIFNPNDGSLEYLLPEIYIIKGKYCRKDFNALNFFKNKNVFAGDQDKIKDEVSNPLLENHKQLDSDIVNQAEIMLDNFSDDDIVVNKKIRTPKTLVGKLCFQNNVRIFNVFDVEEIIDGKLRELEEAQTLENTFNMMNFLFFSHIDEEEGSYNNLKRLREIAAQNFYMMLINWRMQGMTTKNMITQIVGYWNTLTGYEAEYVYVGKWGDTTRGPNSHREYWTNISNKTQSEKINLAIVRLKEEYDFIDNEIIKYIEILNTLGLIDNELYLKIKYGTSNNEKIALLNCGISNTLSNILFEKYKNLYNIDASSNVVTFDKSLINIMRENDENGILISEILLNSPTE
ncbi:DNA helicase [Streptococcus oralis subsp. tigurinus]|uniref:DNA helicase n=4 Tax=Streptococcus TaxID=1301 RepID=A0A1X1G1N6_STROR|nr:DEAD/DEAH box helicase [Streptococcus oralis]MBS3689119.1 DEAD/DEAH box helicase [Streptococcus oralis]MCY7083676.1 DEAD/DEAH box helicase [Streptococcus oralis]MCY7107299.1 DEAD/DEAH box helicase [Streptococcus oralis]ORO33809.1 DNA helicase [Streptococcus oralis subsp. tigurinus]ORO40649.1 DNA helicase [Streptococcus oralis subsp. tigurinus]